MTKRYPYAVESTPEENAIQPGSGYSLDAAIKEISQGQTRIKYEMEKLVGIVSNLATKIDGSSRQDHSEAIEEVHMSNVTREELDAKLGQGKAEVESVASSMRADLAAWREHNTTQMSALQTQLSSLNSKIDGKFEGMEGKLDGLKTSSSSVQWMVGVILALLALAIALPPIQNYFKASEATQTQHEANNNQPNINANENQKK